MVATTQKWNLPVEELGDPSDMPSASGRLTRAIEAALDRLQTSLSGLIAQSVAGRVAKTGDTMSGPLDGVTQLSVAGRVKAGYDLMTGAFSWLSESGELRLVRWSPNLQQADSFPITVNYGNGDTSFQHGVRMPGVPESPGGGEISASTGALVKLADGAVKTFNRTGFALWLNLNPSTRRIKHDITPVSPVGVLDVEPVTFRFNEDVCVDGSTRLGVIAEQVAQVFPPAVVNDESGQPEGVDVVALVTGLIHEVRGLRDRVDALEGGA